MTSLHDPVVAERIAHNIHPGGWTTEFHRPLATLLGSCVSVCLYDTRLKLAGMNHFLLPSVTGKRDDDPDLVLAGDFSMAVLVNDMLRQGANKARMVARAFGGGNVVSAFRTSIGERNAAFAQEWLEREGIPLLGSDFGGAWARKIVFLPATGDAYCRRVPIRTGAMESLIQEEARHAQALAKKLQKPSVDLF